MKWLNLNSLRKRYAALTVVLAIIMLTFSWYAQNQVNQVRKNIETNIESRNILLQRNREIRTAILKSQDLLFKFQIDPKNYTDQTFISTAISRAVMHIERLSEHPWINGNYSSTTHELISTLDEFEKISVELINVRLQPQLLFPSLNIANSGMQPLNAAFTENINLAIKEIEDDLEINDFKEYQLLIELRSHWTTMISSFRMYLLNQLNAFQDYSRE